MSFCGRGSTDQSNPLHCHSTSLLSSGNAWIFLDNVVRHHGLTKTIVTYWDTIFLSTFQKELFKLYGVQLNLSIASHAQSEGQTERINQCLEMYLVWVKPIRD